MTSTRIIDAELPLAAAVIDTIDAIAAGDTLAAADLADRLTAEQSGHAIALLAGIAAGAIDQLAALAHVPRHELIRRMRQQAGS